MSVSNQALKAGMWLAVFNGVAQIFSWISTFAIARMLLPSDYGLMEMATILTGYVTIFQELGLGSAIIQREKVNDEELSSLFWLTVMWGMLLAVVCYFLAYPTVLLFNEERLLPLTQFVSVLFLIAPLNIVPRNLLQRELKFKLFGSLMATATVVSCVAMILFAWFGFGVWTLLFGHIIREFTQLLLNLSFSGWRPKFHFSLKDCFPYLSFGLPVVFAGSIHYLISKTDVFFGGRQFSASVLGHYSFGLRLAEIPKNKLLAIFNSVAYPTFAKLKTSPKEFNDFYLKNLKAITLVASPFYLGGVYVAPDLIPLVLGDKWLAAVLPFQIICIGKLFMTIFSSNQIVTMALGKPRLGLIVNACAFPFVVLAFYYCSQMGEVYYLALPWLLVFPVVHFIFTLITLRLLKLPFTRFLREISGPILALLGMLGILWLVDTSLSGAWDSRWLALSCSVFVGAVVYCSYLFVFEKPIVDFFLIRLKERKAAKIAKLHSEAKN